MLDRSISEDGTCLCSQLSTKLGHILYNNIESFLRSIVTSRSALVKSITQTNLENVLELYPR